MGARTEPLTNSRGQVTQAVFVFTNMLRKLLADERPHYIAAVFESGVPTFRHEMHAGYKANRVAAPEELQRSEEHTSELQSLAYLVCRLLLEKKKKDIIKLADL